MTFFLHRLSELGIYFGRDFALIHHLREGSHNKESPSVFYSYVRRGQMHNASDGILIMRRHSLSQSGHTG